MDSLTVTGKDKVSMMYVDQFNDMSADMLSKLQRMQIETPAIPILQRSMSLALWSGYLISV